MSEVEITRDQRCAIYTRKSTDDRVDRDFNSIESQLDICSAYITCQRHKGWAKVAREYDDPGQSGATVERPALQRLLRDIESGQIDVIVIYKIDRLTRTLADFIRLIEIFDRHQVSFVSVTQSFDTSNAVGRLVLNILLTFAQFERELIADRIRDKFAAMKKRGKYAGGTPPFGYDVVDRKLIVNPAEAATVRHIYKRYLELGCYRALVIELLSQGLRTKVWTSRTGKLCGGKLASNGMIYHILKSPIYVGRVPHHETSYPGEHEAIVDESTWNAALELGARRSKFSGNLAPSPNFLVGLFHDSHGRRMVLSNELKSGKRYRYYVSEQSRWAIREGVKRYRVRADELEELVLAAIKEMMSDREKTRGALLAIGRHGEDLNHLPRRAACACGHLDRSNLELRREILRALIVEGEISQRSLVMVIRSTELVRFLAWDGIGTFRGDRAAWRTNEPIFTLERPLNEMRFERALVMPMELIDHAKRGKILPGLVDLIREARKAQAAVDAERDVPIDVIARRFHRSPSFFCRILRLNYLAPDIIAAILAGAQPNGLTRLRLTQGAPLPLDWDLQRRMFGFPARPDHKMYAPRDMATLVSGWPQFMAQQDNLRAE